MKPKKVSEFPLKPALDGKGFIQIQEGAENKRMPEQVILDALKKKVDAVEGRQLSEENYTKEEKEKLTSCKGFYDITEIIYNETCTREKFNDLVKAIKEGKIIFKRFTDESGSVMQCISSNQSYMAGDSVYIDFFMEKNYVQLQIIEESLKILEKY